MTVLDPGEATMNMTWSLPLIRFHFSKDKDFIKKKLQSNHVNSMFEACKQGLKNKYISLLEDSGDSYPEVVQFEQCLEGRMNYQRQKKENFGENKQR